MANGDRGEVMARVITSVMEAFKKDSDIATNPPLPMVVLVAMVPLKWCELAIHINVQVLSEFSLQFAKVFYIDQSIKNLF